MTRSYYINAVASIAPNGKPESDILSAVEPDYKSIIQNANLRRRMSRIIKMGVACGLSCVDENKTTSIDSIITATGLGCLADTEKFLDTMIEQEEQMLNPTAFIQSTFNTIGSQIALLKGCYGYNNTFVHRNLSFESALLDGMMRINEGDHNVLIGAIDEITPSSHIILKRLGLLDNVIAGEGANFLILGDKLDSSSYAMLCGIKTYTGQLDRLNLKNMIDTFLLDHSVSKSDIDTFMVGKNGNEEQDKIYEILIDELFKSSRVESFKNICGEYFTASSFAMWKAANLLKEKKERKQYLLIYNHFNNTNHALILLASC